MFYSQDIKQVKVLSRLYIITRQMQLSFLFYLFDDLFVC